MIEEAIIITSLEYAYCLKKYVKRTAIKNPETDAINALEYDKIYLEYSWNNDPTVIHSNTYTMGTRPLLKMIGLRLENLKFIATIKAKIITSISRATETNKDRFSMIAEINFFRLIPAAIKKRVNRPSVDEKCLFT